MKRQGGGYLQGFNLQVATDLDSGLIMHTQVVSDQNDSQVMFKFFTEMDKRKKTRNLVADKGYDNKTEVELTELLGINVVTAIKRQRKNLITTVYRKRMMEKLEQPKSQELMKARSFVTEGAFAQLKENLGFRKFFSSWSYCDQYRNRIACTCPKLQTLESLSSYLNIPLTIIINQAMFGIS